MSRDALRVLIVHNRYLEQGGEDVVVEAEAALLRRNGHEVCRFETSNQALLGASPASAAAITVWNRRSRRELADVHGRFKPDIVHFHNTFPLLSPSAYYAAPVSTAVVQTLHNFRLVCPAATLMRDGRPCELCVGRFAWSGVVHACYRGSRSASLASAVMVQAHRALGTWSRRVHAYIALTPFTKQIFVRGGLPAQRVHVKPNFVEPDPGVSTERGRHFLYVGRFDERKGIGVLIDAWSQLEKAPPLRLVGSGPLEAEVAQFAAATPGVQLLGQLPRQRVLGELKSARALIAPMLWYENLPMTICEAMATGCPVIASDLPNIREVLGNGKAGVLFPAGDRPRLRSAVVQATAGDRYLDQIAAAARNLYETHYTAAANYRVLLGIYETALRLSATDCP